MVYYFVRSYTLPDSWTPAMGQKALELVKKSVKYNRQKWPEHDCRFLQNITGEMNRIHLVWKFKSPVESQQFWATYWEDSGIKALMPEWSAAGEQFKAPLLVHQVTSMYGEHDV